MNITNDINTALKEFEKGKKNKSYKILLNIFSKNPNNNLLRFNLAVVQQSLNKIKEAKENYIFLVENQQYTKAMFNLYSIYKMEENYNEALYLVNKIIDKDKNIYPLKKEKAYVLYKLHRYEESIKICLDCLNLNKEDIDCLNILGCNYFEKTDFNNAEKIFKKALEIDNNNSVILNSIGRLYHEKRDTKKAKEFLEKAFNINPNSYEIINNLGSYYKEEAKYEKALSLYKKAIDINSNNPTLINNLAKVYFDLNNLKKAEKLCLEALKIKNDDRNIKMTLSHIYLKKQDYCKAWQYFDGRLSVENYSKVHTSIEEHNINHETRKQLISKHKVLILKEQGVGDELLYGTVYPDLIKSWKNITIECDKRLINLFKTSFSKYENIFVEDGQYLRKSSNLSDYNFVYYAGSLCQYFRNNIKDFKDGCYLKANDELILKSKKIFKEFKGKYNIGISWKSFKNRYIKEKSIDLEKLVNIISNENYNIINLQYGDIEDDLASLDKKLNNQIYTLDDLDIYNDFDYLAGVLKSLDLFISVSNSTAHLAGALGVKTLLIKPQNHATYHYWNQNNNRTPWYNSVQLIEQNDLLEKINNIQSYLSD